MDFDCSQFFRFFYSYYFTCIESGRQQMKWGRVECCLFQFSVMKILCTKKIGSSAFHVLNFEDVNKSYCWNSILIFIVWRFYFHLNDEFYTTLDCRFSICLMLIWWGIMAITFLWAFIIRQKWSFFLFSESVVVFAVIQLNCHWNIFIEKWKPNGYNWRQWRFHIDFL